MRARLFVDGVLLVGLVVAGYTLFILFINSEGARHLRLRAEVELARALQSRLVPTVETRTAQYECLGFSIPSSEVGGDLVEHLALEGHGFAYVADVAGHGIPAGTFMGMVKAVLHMRLDSDHDLGDALTALDRVLTPLKESDRFVTFAGLRIGAGGRVDAALAGHPPILHVTRDGRLRRVDNRHLPLGVLGNHVYSLKSVACGPGDLFVIYSDGLTEVTNPSGELFGIEALEGVVHRCATEPLDRIAAAMLAAVRAHGPQDDDQTLLLVRLA